MRSEAPVVAQAAAAQVDFYDPFLGKTEDEAKQLLRDPYWRLTHLYFILDKSGRTVLFRPNTVQDKFIKDLWYRNVVPKARQRGFSTLIQLMILDACLFVENTGAAIIAQDEDVAAAIRTNKIKFAYDRLPERIRKANPLVVDNITELRWLNGSFLFVAHSTRSATLQWLHVSEYGIICAKRPDHANEIQTGSFPSVSSNGIIVVESTVESDEGNFADMVRRAEEMQQLKRELSKLDFKLHFAAWWDAPEYELDPRLAIITKKDHDYFDRLEILIGADPAMAEAWAAIGRRLSPAKRAWYVTMRDSEFGGDQEKMWKQYPSTLAEAFTISTEGTWLAAQLARARLEGRITRVPYDAATPVNTFWDIGVDDDIGIWFHQMFWPRHHFIDFYEINDVPYSVVVKDLQAKGYVWGRHFLPHDGNHRRPGTDILRTSRDMLEELGLRNIEVVDRVQEKIHGINMLRESFGTYWFDEEKCKGGLHHLSQFKKTWIERHARFVDLVAQNGHQHAADAIMQHAQARDILRSGVSSSSKKRPRPGAMAL